MNLLLRELKTNRRSLLIWTAILALLNLMMMALFPSFAADAEQLEGYIDVFPEEFSRIFGLDKLNMTEPIGFYSVEAYFMVVLFGSMFAAMLGTTMLSKEEDEKTIEFLLAKPVSRSQVVTGKVLAVLMLLVILNLVIAAVTVASFEIFVSGYSRAELARLLIAPFIGQLAFAGLGLLLSVFLARRRAAISAGIGLVLGLYFLNVIANLTDKLDFLRFLSPFWYIEAADIVEDGFVPWKLALMLGVVAATVAATYWTYNQKDITI